tara:strand:- start:1106 stop:1420 length:315 start_codon:yes stop_codon:yes gene_type:complete
MAKELNEETGFQISIKTLMGIAFGIATIVGMWFALQADIAEAKELPRNEWNPEWEEKLPSSDVSRMEFDMKDKNIRITIENTEKAVDELKDRLIRMEDKIDDLR